MNKPGILLLLAMGLAAACDQVPMTRYEYEDITLEVGARVKTVPPQTAAATGLDPSVRYSPDRPVRQVAIEVRFLSADETFEEIVGADFLLGSGETIAPTSVEDTTPRPGGGGPSLGFGLGGLGGLGNDDDLASDDAYTDDNRHRDDNGLTGSGVGVVLPLREGDTPSSTRATSARFLFEIEFVPVIDENYQLRIVLVVVGEDLEPGLQPVILPVKLTAQSDEAAELRSASPIYIVVEQENPLILGSPFLTTEEAESRIPHLGDLPLIGNLFGSRTDDLPRRDLLVFLTPHIVPVQE